MFSKLRILLFVCFRSTHGWMGMDVWVNVFTMPFFGLRTWTSPEENLQSFPAVAYRQHWTGRGQLIAGVMFGELSVSLFVTLGVCMGGSVNVEVVRKGIIAVLVKHFHKCFLLELS